MDLSAIAQCLGLAPDATIDDIVAAIKALQGGTAPTSPVASSEQGAGGATAAPVTETAMPGAPGCAGVQQSPKKTTVSIQHSADTAAVLELSQKLANIEAERTTEKRNALIAANASKLTPVLEKWARTQSIETLTTFFSAAAPVSQIEVESRREPVTGTQTIELTSAELLVCKETGVDPKTVLAYKQKEAARGAVV